MSGINEGEIRASPLWGHMTHVLAQVLRERPTNALTAMGAASHQALTGSALPPSKGNLYADPRPVAAAAAAADAFTNTRWAASTTAAIAPPPPPRRPRRADDEEEEEEMGSGAANVMQGEDEDARRLSDLADHPGTLSDVVTEQSYFNLVGTGLPPSDAYRVLVGLRQLIRAEPLSSARFWGIVTSTRLDYYIAECQPDAERTADGDEGEMDEEEEDEHAPLSQVADVLCSSAKARRSRNGPVRSIPAEETGTGLNSLCYYVSTGADLMSWTRLPDVAPHHITIARQLRYRLSGDLDSAVRGHPRFLGTERHYLRAQIARISSACRVAPSQMFTTEGAVPEDEDEGNLSAVRRTPPTSVPAYAAVPPLIPQEAPDPEDAEAVAAVVAWFGGYNRGELLQAKGWAHIAPTILNSGRTALPPAMDDDEEDGEGETRMALNNTDMIAPFLSDLSVDAPVSYPGHSRSALSAWVFRKAYQSEGCTTAVYAAKSLRWPGAISYAVTASGRPGASYQMLYVGNGLKDLQGAFYAPPLPPPCGREYTAGTFDGDRDCTAAEEARYVAPPPRSMTADDANEEEEEEEDS